MMIKIKDKCIDCFYFEIFNNYTKNGKCILKDKIVNAEWQACEDIL